MRRYAHDCIDVVHAHLHAVDLPLHTIALVQGDALGGGWEGALAQDVIIAERSAKFAFPETLFNLFPGMGAYTLIARRLSAVQAEEMIMSGRVYTAEELQQIGLVEVVAEDGQGEAALYEYIRRHERSRTSRQSIFSARRIVKPVSREELIRIVDLWVDAAMSLQPGDLRKMQRLAKAQNRRTGIQA
jgi:DSF synthase